MRDEAIVGGVFSLGVGMNSNDCSSICECFDLSCVCLSYCSFPGYIFLCVFLLTHFKNGFPDMPDLVTLVAYANAFFPQAQFSSFHRRPKLTKGQLYPPCLSMIWPSWPCSVQWCHGYWLIVVMLLALCSEFWVSDTTFFSSLLFSLALRVESRLSQPRGFASDWMWQPVWGHSQSCER